MTDEGANVVSVLANCSAVRTLCKTDAPKSWSPKLPTQTFIQNWYWHPEATVVWGVLPRRGYHESSQYYPLWILPQVNTMSATNSAFMKHLMISYWQNTTAAQWPVGVRACTQWMWYV
jgi:hypothetical protein